MIADKDIKKYKDTLVPWGPIGYIVYKRTYSRTKEDGTKEEWFDTVKRCVNGIDAIAPKGLFTKDDLLNLFDSIFNLKCCLSGRALWQLGTENIERFGGDSLQNCWNVQIDEPIDPFLFIFNELMLGGGVGFNIQAPSVYSLPIVKNYIKVQKASNYDCTIIVPDNREGWISLLELVLRRAFFGDDRVIRYNTSCIRRKGAEIKTFGGVSSGPEELEKGIEDIVNILNKRVGHKLTPVDVLDICNIIGRIVVSGNVRRSAQCALGDVNDLSFLNAKNWNSSKVPSWRSMSNNNICAYDVEDLTSDYWSSLIDGGESCGIVNIKNCRNYGRISDGLNYKPDHLVCGTNPCGEITLESYEPCNLAEIFLPNIKNTDELLIIGELLYKCCKSITTLPYLHSKTDDVVKRNRRIGIGVTGIMECKYRYNIEVFDRLYNHIDQLDQKTSAYYGFNKSIKLTTVKPSGTVSLLAGVTPGIHPAFAPYYIRRVRMAENDPLVDVCISHGYDVEPEIDINGNTNLNTMVVSFPIASSPEAVCEEDTSVIDQLSNIKFFQEYYSDNSVSCTVYYRPEELLMIKDWVTDNFDSVKSLSFSLKQDHSYHQPPMEEITEEKYKEMMAKSSFIDRIHGESELKDNFECSSGACPIK